ncbi:MAG: hypothetical protein AW08_01271 [Candidatus Accumulibacter adjunctus]|uniref:PEP-CTERM protein-sorting domain-containing protein n=1 Tax=Candidatus Accumulibacter adjunctus TaxID=1454001 RepID=A0A011PQA6_9PROT|nr:MAG: hypothetical protein AW08_01271 [Candidatus Accumulibacter adjunctus]
MTTKPIPLTFIGAAILLALAPPVHAQAVPIGLFPTGVDANSSARPDGTNELHYDLIAAPAPMPPGVPIVNAGPSFPVSPGGPWLADSPVTGSPCDAPTSRWIAPTQIDILANGIATIHPFGGYTYRTTFDLTGFDPTTAVIAGCWAADNAGTDILINASPTFQSALGFTGWTPFTIAAGFLPNLNDLDFAVFNAIGPSGLRVVFTEATAQRLVAEPWSLALVGMALTGLGMFRWRQL